MFKTDIVSLPMFQIGPLTYRELILTDTMT